MITQLGKKDMVHLVASNEADQKTSAQQGDDGGSGEFVTTLAGSRYEVAKRFKDCVRTKGARPGLLGRLLLNSELRA